MTKVVEHLTNDDGYSAKVLYSEDAGYSIQFFTPANLLVGADTLFNMDEQAAKNVAAHRLENVTRLWKENTLSNGQEVLRG